MATYPTAAATDAELFVAVNNLSTTLNGAIDSITTTVVLTSSAGFPTAGYATVDNEAIKYTGITVNTLTGVTRGADGTTAAAHLTGALVQHTVIANHHNTLKEEIKAIETDLGSRIAFGTDRLRGVAGTAVLPTHSFSADPNSGLYDISDDILGLSTGGTERIRLSTTLWQSSIALTLTPTTNQVILGTTRTVTLNAPTPATTSRTHTIPDISADGTFSFLEGTQTFSGAKTFSAATVHSNTVTINDATSNALLIQGSANGQNPRAFISNTNGTAGQDRISILGARGDNGTTEVSMKAGKDSSNNSVEMFGGTTKLQLAIGGVSRVEIAPTSFDLTPTTANSQKLGTTALPWSQVIGGIHNATLAAGNNSNYVLNDSTNAQEAYMGLSSGAASNDFILSVNRNIAGTVAKTGQAVAAMQFESASTDGNITFYTTATNNTAPTLRVKITKGGETLFSDGTNALPSISFNNSTSMGLFRQASTALGISTNAVEVGRFDASATTDDMRFLVFDVTAAALVRVSRGASNSGGAGFRLLKVPN